MLVEALRVDYTHLPNRAFCEHCGMASRELDCIYLLTVFICFINALTAVQTIRYPYSDEKGNQHPSGGNNEEYLDVSLKIPPSFALAPEREDDSYPLTNVSIERPASPKLRETMSAPSAGDGFRGSRPVKRSTVNIANNNESFGSVRLADRPEWSNNEFRMF